MRELIRRISIVGMSLGLIACANTPATKYARVFSYAPPPDMSTPLAQKISQVQTNNGQSGVYPLSDGIEALAIRTSLIKAAQKTLDIQYHSIHAGNSTTLLLNETILAARRGVKVRILIDGVDAQGKRSDIDQIAAHPNIDIRVYNPVQRFNGNFITRNAMFLLHLKKLHRRMHHKILIADGVMGLTGGRNIGDAYFNADSDDNFSDLDVLLGGPAIKSLEQSFDAYWNSSNTLPVQALHFKRDQAKPEEVQVYDRKIKAFIDKARAQNNPYLLALERVETTMLPKAVAGMTWADTQILSDPADKINRNPSSRVIKLPDAVNTRSNDPDTVVFNQVAQMIQSAKHEVVIANAYILLGEAFTQLLESLPKKGVRVVLVTNSLESNDVPFVMGHYDPYRRRLLNAGVEWYELRGFPNVRTVRTTGRKRQFYSNGQSRTTLHSKAMVVDNQHAFVGSMNFDPRSIIWNTELGVFVDSAAFAQRIRQLILNATQPIYSYKVRLESDGRLIWPLSPAPSAYDIKYNINRPLDQEPGSNFRKVEKWLSKLVPETYM